MPDEFESQLRAALRAGEPGPGFAARVAARAVQAGARPRRPRIWLWAAAVAALIVLVAGGWSYQRQRRQAMAAQQLQIAVAFTNAQLSRITNVALGHAIQRFDQENHD